MPTLARVRLFVAVAAFFVTASAAPVTTAASATDALAGKVVHIADGDTITLLDSSNVQHKIRLWGIDAPERKQPFGTKAKDALGGKIHEKQVTVETHGTDKYGRTLGTVFVDGENVNLWLVAGGWAWWYRRYAPKATEVEEAEQQARRETRGLWADKEPLPPWEWRRAEKEKRKRKAGGEGSVVK